MRYSSQIQLKQIACSAEIIYTATSLVQQWCMYLALTLK